MRPSDFFAGRVFVVAMAIAVPACTTSDPSSSSSSPTTNATARELWDKSAWAAFGNCVGCHGSQPAIDYLAPGTSDGAYATIFTFQPPVLNLDSPDGSLVLTMGQHTGPPLAPADATAILAWITQEQTERAAPTAMPVEYGPVTATMNAMTTIPLAEGATLAFFSDSLDGNLDISQVAITTGATGIHVTHPLFASRPPQADEVVDAADHYSDIDADIAASSTLMLDPATFIGLSATAPFTVDFLELEAL